MSSIQDMFYNLATVAPGKGQAKKTVSTGLTRLELTVNDGKIEVRGLATDDVLSIYQQVTIELAEAAKVFGQEAFERTLHEDVVGYFYPDTLRAMSGGEPSAPDRTYDQSFDEKFWRQHVMGSIFDQTPSYPLAYVKVMPDRLRKFSLLKPQDQPLELFMTEWADRTIIRWRYNKSAYGIYAPLDSD